MSKIETTRPSFFPNSPSAQAIRDKNISRINKMQESYGPTKTGEPKGLRDARVDIPEKIKDYAQIQKAVTNAPERDESQKIAEIKAKIASGEYKINEDAIATKMLEQEF